MTPTPEQRAEDVLTELDDPFFSAEASVHDLAVAAIASAIRAAESAAAAEAVEREREAIVEECEAMFRRIERDQIEVEAQHGSGTVWLENRNKQRGIERVVEMVKMRAIRSTPAPKESADD